MVSEGDTRRGGEERGGNGREGNGRNELKERYREEMAKAS